jgi:hypothetical protein
MIMYTSHVREHIHASVCFMFWTGSRAIQALSRPNPLGHRGRPNKSMTSSTTSTNAFHTRSSVEHATCSSAEDTLITCSPINTPAPPPNTHLSRAHPSSTPAPLSKTHFPSKLIPYPDKRNCLTPVTPLPSTPAFLLSTHPTIIQVYPVIP